MIEKAHLKSEAEAAAKRVWEEADQWRYKVRGLGDPQTLIK